MTEPLSDDVAALEAAVDALLDAPVDTFAPVRLARLLQAVEVQRRRLEAVDQRLLAAAAVAGVPAAFGQPSVAAVLVPLLRIDPREAAARVARAADLGPRRALTGEPLEPIFPATAAALAVGELSSAQADVIRECADELPPGARADAVELIERVLLTAARTDPPRLLRRAAKQLLARLDPEGLEPAEQRAHRRRAFTLVRRPDGTSTPRGLLTAEVTAQLTTVLDALSAPQGVDGEPDPRSAAQRRHDGLGEAMSRVLRSDTLPAAGGAPVTILATTTIAELTAAVRDHAPDGLALLGTGETVSTAALLAMASDASVVPVIFNDAGGIVAFGRERRLASRGQRLALAARDGGCSFPACDRPVVWTEVHHVASWLADDGPTDLDNLCLLCRYHHRTIDKTGWEVRMRDGRPEWLPPPWIDPDRRPRRNTVHHLREIEFRQPGEVA